MSKKKRSSSSNQQNKVVNVIYREKLVKRPIRQISPQFHQFKEQNPGVAFKRKQLIHPQLTKYQRNTPDDYVFDHFAFLRESQRIIRQGCKQDKDSRKEVKIHDRYPYNCYGKVKAYYRKETSMKQKSKVVDHKNFQNEQEKDSYSYGIAAWIGKGLMFTAAHVVPDELKGKKLIKIEVIFLYSKYRLQVQKVIIHPQYQQFQRQKTISPFDMAVLVMKPHSKFEYPQQFLQIQWDYNLQDSTQNEFKFLTFKETKQSKLMLMEANHNQIVQADQWSILYKNTTYEGDSGSLILLWKRKENLYKVVGIHIGEQRKQNYGILLTTKSHSPKDIFSQMIEYNLQLQQNQKIRNNSSQLKNSDLQMKKESSAIQIMTQLKQHKNYQLSTLNYIKQLEQKNRKLKREVKQQKQIIQKQLHIKDTGIPDKLETSLNNTLKNISFHQQKNKQLDNKETPKKDYNKVQPKSISSNQFSISSESINQPIQFRGDENKNEAVKVQTPKNNLQKGKQSENKSKTKKLNKKQQNQQYNCLAEMCKIFINWLYRRPAKITNANESSNTILQE